ncbi:MAG: DUF805 domain-containing protein [Pseudomonadota bacterium]
MADGDVNQETHQGAFTGSRYDTSKVINLEGRISRAAYAKRMLTLFAIVIPLVLVAKTMQEVGAVQGRPLLELAGAALIVLPALAVAPYSIALTVRRFHDLGVTGWWTLIYFLPFSILVTVFLMIKKGTDGPNAFGEAA